MNQKQLKVFISDASGVTLIELMIVLVIITIMTGFSMFYLTGHQKLYKPDEQAFRIVDVLQEARQRALTQRETIRVEIDTTAGFVRILEENTPSTATDDKEIRRIKLLSSNEIRVDAAPSNMNYTPPESLPVPVAVFRQSIYPGSINDQVCTIRFQSNGNVVNAGTNTTGSGSVATGVTLYIWAPKTGSTGQAEIARAITIVGASGSIRFWEFDASITGTNKWKDSRRTGAYAS